ncbi:MAG: serine/threonine protein kinase [Pirellulaceae bacterium]
MNRFSDSEQSSPWVGPDVTDSQGIVDDQSELHVPARKGNSGDEATPANEPELPFRIGRYLVQQRLGHGGFGLVYLAVDTELQREVAIKVPLWDRPLDDGAVDRFMNEGRLLAKLEHPSIVTVHDVGRTDAGVPYVVMQYVEGKTLYEVLKRKKLSFSRTMQFLVEIADALRVAHRETLVHRDFKPGNVIIDTDGGIHIVDFGMALHDDLTLDDFKDERPVGTPVFMAPEQMRGENHRIDGRTDIWAFGVTMYYMLTGRLPFRNEERKELTRTICYQNPKPLRQLNDRVSKELERVCLRCLGKLMTERYQSMPDLLEELQAAAMDYQTQHGEAGHDSGEKFTPGTAASAAATQGSVFSGFGASQSAAMSAADVTGFMSMAGSDIVDFVPKGLASYDANDHEFFLQLLPGPTDRLGVPESIRFWISRLGVEDRVDDVPI